MHKKSFFQGLGLGMVVVSVIFLVLYSTKGKETRETEDKDAQIEETTEETSSLLDLPDKEEQVETVSQMTVEVSETETIDGIVSGIDKPDLEIKSIEEDLPEINDIKRENEEEVKKVSDTAVVVIESGDRAADVCRKLYAAGVIDSEKGFAEYMRGHGVSRKVLYGRFEIPKGATYDEIYGIIKTHG